MKKNEAIRYIMRKLDISYVPYYSIINIYLTDEDIPKEYIDLLIEEGKSGKTHIFSGNVFVTQLKHVCDMCNIKID